MSDFNIREIEQLKFRIRSIERISMVGMVAIILGFFYSWESAIGYIIFFLIIIQIYKWRLGKKLKQKEFLAKIVEERTIELRIQRDQVLVESEKLAAALEALAKAQDELVRKERLATVGQLTKGLVDRILNPLNYINNFASLSMDLVRELKDYPAIAEGKSGQGEEIGEVLTMLQGNLNKIAEHGSNTVRIVKAMEELLKDSKGSLSMADLHDLCKVNIDVIGKAFEREIAGKGIQINLQSPQPHPKAEIDIEQMSKVLLNLLKNSMYALLKKAEKTDFIPSLIVRLEKTGSDISICVKDNGIGIENNIKTRVFEPFFTTKPTAEAAGTGLYFSREVILNHKGSIQVNSEKGIYSEFRVTIPIYQKSENDERLEQRNQIS